MTESSCCERLRRSVSRVKVADAGLAEVNPLQRCLSAADLALLGIGAMVGSGFYILTGEVVGNLAGPAATLSFLIAGVACLLTALLYTECATRFPQTGASYTFTYISLGEFMAFLVGWNFIATWVFIVAFVSRGWSAYFDNIIGDQIRNLTTEYLLGGVEWNIPVVAQYPDITGGVVVLLATIPIALGTSISAKANGFFVIVNILIIALVFVIAMIHADFSYLTKNGYFPMGFNGVLVGAAVCFGSGYGGFQIIAFSAEEAKNPSTSLPIGIISAFVVTILNYIAGVIAITVLSEYQNINPDSAFVTAFEGIGLDWIKYVVGIGGLCSMTGSILNCIFCLSRNIFAMARDGLIPNILARNNRKTKTPVIATLFGSALAVVINIFIDFEVIIHFVSLGSLADYIVVSVVTIFLRYRAPIKSEPTLSDSDNNEILRTSDVKMTNLPEILRKSDESHCETEKTQTHAKRPGQSALTKITTTRRSARYDA